VVTAAPAGRPGAVPVDFMEEALVVSPMARRNLTLVEEGGEDAKGRGRRDNEETERAGARAQSRAEQPTGSAGGTIPSPCAPPTSILVRASQIAKVLQSLVNRPVATARPSARPGPSQECLREPYLQPTVSAMSAWASPLLAAYFDELAEPGPLAIDSEADGAPIPPPPRPSVGVGAVASAAVTIGESGGGPRAAGTLAAAAAARDVAWLTVPDGASAHGCFGGGMRFGVDGAELPEGGTPEQAMMAQDEEEADESASSPSDEAPTPPHVSLHVAPNELIALHAVTQLALNIFKRPPGSTPPATPTSTPPSTPRQSTLPRTAVKPTIATASGGRGGAASSPDECGSDDPEFAEVPRGPAARRFFEGLAKRLGPAPPPLAKGQNRLFVLAVPLFAGPTPLPRRHPQPSPTSLAGSGAAPATNAGAVVHAVLTASTAGAASRQPPMPPPPLLLGTTANSSCNLADFVDIDDAWSPLFSWLAELLDAGPNPASKASRPCATTPSGILRSGAAVLHGVPASPPWLLQRILAAAPGRPPCTCPTKRAPPGPFEAAKNLVAGVLCSAPPARLERHQSAAAGPDSPEEYVVFELRAPDPATPPCTARHDLSDFPDGYLSAIAGPPPPSPLPPLPPSARAALDAAFAALPAVSARAPLVAFMRALAGDAGAPGLPVRARSPFGGPLRIRLLPEDAILHGPAAPSGPVAPSSEASAGGDTGGAVAAQGAPGTVGESVGEAIVHATLLEKSAVAPHGTSTTTRPSNASTTATVCVWEAIVAALRALTALLRAFNADGPPAQPAHGVAGVASGKVCGDSLVALVEAIEREASARELRAARTRRNLVEATQLVDQVEEHIMRLHEEKGQCAAVDCAMVRLSCCLLQWLDCLAGLGRRNIHLRDPGRGAAFHLASLLRAQSRAFRANARGSSPEPSGGPSLHRRRSRSAAPASAHATSQLPADGPKGRLGAVTTAIRTLARLGPGTRGGSPSAGLAGAVDIAAGNSCTSTVGPASPNRRADDDVSLVVVGPFQFSAKELVRQRICSLHERPAAAATAPRDPDAKRRNGAADPSTPTLERLSIELFASRPGVAFLLINEQPAAVGGGSSARRGSAATTGDHSSRRTFLVRPAALVDLLEAGTTTVRFGALDFDVARLLVWVNATLFPPRPG